MKSLLSAALVLLWMSPSFAKSKGDAFTRELRSLYSTATTGQPPTPEERVDAAYRYYWLTRAKRLCEYSVESQKDCEGALLGEEFFDGKRFCVGAEKKGDRKGCLKEAEQIQNALDDFDKQRETAKKPEELNDLAKRIAKRGLETAKPSPSGPTSNSSSTGKQ